MKQGGGCIDNFNVNTWVKEIEFFHDLGKEKYLNFCQNALNFAKENLTVDKFKDFWLNIIKES